MQHPVDSNDEGAPKPTGEAPTDELSHREDLEAQEERVRDHLRRSGTAAKDAAKASAGVLRGKGRRVGDAGKGALDTGREAVDRSYRTVTLQTYRDEVDEALQQIVDVLAAQDAEIKHLRGRVAQLEAAPGNDAPAEA